MLGEHRSPKSEKVHTTTNRGLCWAQYEDIISEVQGFVGGVVPAVRLTAGGPRPPGAPGTPPKSSDFSCRRCPPFAQQILGNVDNCLPNSVAITFKSFITVLGANVVSPVLRTTHQKAESF